MRVRRRTQRHPLVTATPPTATGPATPTPTMKTTATVATPMPTTATATATATETEAATLALTAVHPPLPCDSTLPWSLWTMLRSRRQCPPQYHPPQPQPALPCTRRAAHTPTLDGQAHLAQLPLPSHCSRVVEDSELRWLRRSPPTACAACTPPPTPLASALTATTVLHGRCTTSLSARAMAAPWAGNGAIARLSRRHQRRCGRTRWLGSGVGHSSSSAWAAPWT